VVTYLQQLAADNPEAAEAIRARFDKRVERHRLGQAIVTHKHAISPAAPWPDLPHHALTVGYTPTDKPVPDEPINPSDHRGAQSDTPRRCLQITLAETTCSSESWPRPIGSRGHQNKTRRQHAEITRNDACCPRRFG
jgi:hypothetical protein